MSALIRLHSALSRVIISYVESKSLFPVSVKTILCRGLIVMCGNFVWAKPFKTTSYYRASVTQNSSHLRFLYTSSWWGKHLNMSIYGCVPHRYVYEERVWARLKVIWKLVTVLCTVPLHSRRRVHFLNSGVCPPGGLESLEYNVSRNTVCELW
jgi:hypothetical protein